MKIALAQINVIIGDFEGNSSTIIKKIEEAKLNGIDLIVFPELSVCGYPPQDFLEFDDFIQKSYLAVESIAKHCNGIAAIVGSPTKNPNIEGKNLYNSACFLTDGKVQAYAHKALLPNYDIFDEYRYFEPSKSFSCITFKGKKIALTICEDIWDIDDDPLYTLSPMKELLRENPDFAINISASPFSYAHLENREKVVSYWAKKGNLPVFYVNYWGAQTELIFDGNSLVSNTNGEIIAKGKAFEEDLIVIDTDNLPSPLTNYKEEKVARIYQALVCGIKDYFQKMGFKKALLGLSGGIDSALTATLAVDALGAENVTGILLPSKFSSDHSVSDAEQLAINLGMSYTTIPIEPIFQSFEKALEPLFKGLPFNVAEENLQSRIRGTLLMAHSNKFNGILLNTSNKSEAAVGYGTLYGDMNGGLAVLGDVYKTEVYELSNYINRDIERIPKNSIQKAPSAELRPGQKDSDSLPDYDILDKILYQYIEQRKGPNDIIAMGFDESLVKRILRMVNKVEFKRKQTAPILRISIKAFGHGRRMPIVGKYLD